MKILLLCSFCFVAFSSHAADIQTHPIVQESISYYKVVLPDDYNDASSANRTYPVCIIIHGSGGYQDSAIGLAENRLEPKNVIYLLPRANHPRNSVFFNGERPGFTAWPEHGYSNSSSVEINEEDEIEELVIEKLYTKLIHDCLKDARERYRVSDDKVVVIGHSQGGAFAFRFAVDYPHEVQAAFMGAGYYKSRLSDSNAGNRLKENGVHIYFTHNEDDHLVDFENGTLLLDYLKEHDVDFEHTFYPDGKHRLRDAEWAKAKLFVDKWLRGI